MTRRGESFKLNATWLFAIVGGVVAFVVSGAIVAAAWVAFGALIGGAIGWAVQRFTSRVKDFESAVDLAASETKSSLYEKAKDLGIEGRSKMAKEELAAAVTEQRGDG